jgi:hypothetical protein
MIVFINGTFGVGKTTVAERLAGRLPGSVLFDAELVGCFLRRIVAPIENPDDFQDLAMWRSLTVTTARALRATYGRTLIMPMTIARRDYFREIVGGLRATEPDLHHFTLTATPATLEARIRRGGEAIEWRLDHLLPCTAALAAPEFATHIATDGKTPGEVVDALLARLPV